MIRLFDFVFYGFGVGVGAVEIFWEYFVWGLIKEDSEFYSILIITCFFIFNYMYIYASISSIVKTKPKDKITRVRNNSMFVRGSYYCKGNQLWLQESIHTLILVMWVFQLYLFEGDWYLYDSMISKFHKLNWLYFSFTCVKNTSNIENMAAFFIAYYLVSL